MMTEWRFRRLVKVAIIRLKNNQVAGPNGLISELFKTGFNELVGHMQQLIYKIWLEDSVPSVNISVLCPVLKRGDPIICVSYRAISLIPIAYRVLTGALCERLKPLIKTLINPYQCGQNFTLRQILEKTHETQSRHHLFVDYKAAFDSIISDPVFVAMTELFIPAKLIRLCKMTLSNSCRSVKVVMDFSEIF